MVNEEVRKRIGERIRELRVGLNMSQEELAERCGMKRVNIRSIEQGRYGAQIDVIENIVSVFGMHLEIE